MIDPAKVVSVYSGKPGCACGCRGKHSTNPRTIKLIVNKINTLKPTAKLEGNHWYAETPTRLYIAYADE